MSSFKAYLRTLTILQLPRFDSPTSYYEGIKRREPGWMTTFKTCLRTSPFLSCQGLIHLPHITEELRRKPRRMSSFKTCWRTLTIPQLPRFDSCTPHTTEELREGNQGECRHLKPAWEPSPSLSCQGLIHPSHTTEKLREGKQDECCHLKPAWEPQGLIHPPHTTDELREGNQDECHHVKPTWEPSPFFRCQGLIHPTLIPRRN